MANKEDSPRLVWDPQNQVFTLASSSDESVSVMKEIKQEWIHFHTDEGTYYENLVTGEIKFNKYPE